MPADRNGPSRWRPLVPRTRARDWAEHWALRGRPRAERDQRIREGVARETFALPSGYTQDVDFEARERQAREAGFRGRGPKGYRRDDERLRALVCERLADDPWIDATDVEVSVVGGEVALSGSVLDDRSLREAEEIARRSGARSVTNTLVIRPA
jgi:osmotically-inducible protein OsmY